MGIFFYCYSHSGNGVIYSITALCICKNLIGLYYQDILRRLNRIYFDSCALLDVAFFRHFTDTNI